MLNQAKSRYEEIEECTVGAHPDKGLEILDRVHFLLLLALMLIRNSV